MQKIQMHIGGRCTDSACEAMREYLQVKSVWINTGAHSGNPLVMR